MYVRNLSGIEYVIQATSTHVLELNGNQSLSFTVLPSKVNSLFIDDIGEMWEVVDDNDVTHKIIYAKKKGEGARLNVDIKAVPLFFDTFDNERIYDEYNEHMTAMSAFTKIFEDMPFGFILVDTFYAVEWDGFGAGETRLETFKRALERYKAEFRIVGNTVYLERQIGRDTSFMYRYRLNASNIVKEIDAHEMWTYAKGYGNYGNEGEGDGGTSDWKDANLIREYTSPLAQILGLRHAPPIKDGRVTVNSAMDSALQTLVDDSLKISISTDIHDLRRQGYAIAQPELGDRVFVIDERIGLDEEVRVINMTVTKDWRGNVMDLKLTIGSDGLTKRHQSNISTAVDRINELVEGTRKLPYGVLDNAVLNATKALQNAQTELSFGVNGILAADKNDPNLLTLLNSAGLGVSRDGGNTFENAITGEGINATVITSGAMLADRIAGGILTSLNGRTIFNLNDGLLYMENTNFELGGGALIQFTSSGNRLRYTHNNRHSGIAFGTSINDEYGFVAMGATNVNQPFTVNDDSGFSGFLANHFGRETVDGIQNSVVGRRFHVRDKAISFSRGFLFKTDNDAYFSPMNTGTHSYDLGRPNNRWNGTYLRSNPDVSSDRKLKTDIKVIDKDFARDFLSVDAKRYKKKLTNADLGEGIRGSNPYEFGFIAQEVERIFSGVDMRFESLVSTAKDGSKSMQYGQISAIHHVLLQDIYNKVEALENGT